MSTKFNNTTINNINFNNTPICKLKYNGTLVWENHAYGSWKTTTTATCTTAGSKKRTCTRTGCGCSETGTIAALGHKWSDAYYLWGFDNASCTARRSCANTTSHTGQNPEIATGTVTCNTTAATCTATGLKAYTATFGVPWADQQYKEEIIDKLAHNEVLDVSVVATCTTAGKTAGSHCSVCNTVIIPQTLIKALGHSWASPSYSWSGYTSCTATRLCSRDASHKQTATTTNITSTTAPATCTTNGTTTYTATFSESWAENRTKTETIPATGHSWSKTLYSFAADYSSCTATRKCMNDITHEETQTTTMVTESVIKQPTCTTKGTKKYVAIFNAATGLDNWATECTQTVNIPATGHTAGNWETTKQPTLTTTGTKVQKCTVCNTVIATETIPMLDPETDTYEMLLPNAVTLKAYEYTDNWGDYGNSRAGDELVAGGYLKNNSNIAVPVLYKNDVENYDEPDMGDAFFYVGQGTFNGVTCDKWRKIGNPAAGDCDTEFTWTSSIQQYIYTNVIVSNNRFIDGLFGLAVSDTVLIDWSVINRPNISGLNNYSLSSLPVKVSAPAGYTIVEVTNISVINKGLLSGAAPILTATGTISSDGKTVSIALSCDLQPLRTGSGTAEIAYTLACKEA